MPRRQPLSGDTDAIVCAAGLGTRMRSHLPKPAQLVGGKALLAHILDTLAEVLDEDTHPIVTYNRANLETLQEAVGEVRAKGSQWAEQATPDGTGGAVRAGLAQVTRGKTLVVYADVPLVRPQTLRDMIALCPRGGMALLTMQPDDPHGYGRVIRDSTGSVVRVEEQDEISSEESDRLREVNAGIMVFDTDTLRELEPDLPLHENGEYYLPGMVALCSRAEAPVQTLPLADPSEVLGANTRRQLHDLERLYSLRAAAALMEKGVSVADMGRLDIRGQVEVGEEVWLDVNVVLEGQVRLGSRVRVGPGCVLRDVQVEDGAEIRAYSVLEEAVVGPDTVVGPFARLRPGTSLARGAMVGNFVETKNAELGEGAKASHLAYIGDASVGGDANIGAGVIFANYDGKDKHHSRVGEGAFVGSNSVLVAPANVGARAKVAAGSAIDKPVPDDALAFGRARQKVREKKPPKGQEDPKNGQ